MEELACSTAAVNSGNTPCSCCTIMASCCSPVPSSFGMKVTFICCFPGRASFVFTFRASGLSTVFCVLPQSPDVSNAGFRLPIVWVNLSLKNYKKRYLIGTASQKNILRRSTAHQNCCHDCCFQSTENPEEMAIFPFDYFFAKRITTSRKSHQAYLFPRRISCTNKGSSTVQFAFVT